MITNYITIDGVTTQADLEDEKGKIDTDVASLLRDDEKIPLNKLAKYYLNENLNFLCGSGTSVAIGGKTINKSENPFASIITELKVQMHNIANKGFSGMRRVVARFNFSCKLIGKKPAVPYWTYCQPLYTSLKDKNDT